MAKQSKHNPLLTGNQRQFGLRALGRIPGVTPTKPSRVPIKRQDKPSAGVRSFERERGRMQKAADAYHRELRLTKATAHRMACTVIMLRRDYPDDFRRQIGRLTFDQFVAKTFSPLAKLGGDPLRLIREVERGLTLEQYLARPTT